ncbi:dolichyl-diphosphooligosaccharide--protein glycosyltransferase subunit STT3 [Hibiscus syriacus]|uniref:Dolichyl-diphosphooligosaccharide--protein glycosyltransferase subunit STT3 n=1 Tax=Hibiscus syriacus TaxID=106335 RepID=A0A6A3D0P0_HIBSY|nr:dolichyl-diphosphooligosaccharide--protein glycosyltransferase subunit STT3 [Hibiscus syriacus]
MIKRLRWIYPPSPPSISPAPSSAISTRWNCRKSHRNLFNDAAIEPFSNWDSLSGLEELILGDNKLTKIQDVGIFKKLLIFDVSFNAITSLQGLSEASSTIKKLYVSKNEVTKMEEIGHLHELQILELGSNRLRVMENLQNFTKLQELWPERNRIKVINLCGLSCIKKISFQSNRLTSMRGLEECIALEEIYLSHNGLWLNDNKIESLDGLAEAVSGSREKLTTIYLENNPCAKSPNYNVTLKQIFPNIQQIDSEVFA